MSEIGKTLSVALMGFGSFAFMLAPHLFWPGVCLLAVSTLWLTARVIRALFFA